MQMSADQDRQEWSISMKIWALEGRQSGLNFIERGHMGVIKMFSIVRSIRGPCIERDLQQLPMGVEIKSPSPLNSPILILSPSQLLSIYRLSTSTPELIPLCTYIWQVASAIFLQSMARDNFISLSQGRLSQLFSCRTRGPTSWKCEQLKLYIRGIVQSSVFPMPKIGGESLHLNKENAFIKSGFSPRTKTSPILFRVPVSLSEMTVVFPSLCSTREQQ